MLPNPMFQAFMTKVLSSIEEISAQELQHKLSSGEQVNLIDIREGHEWQRGAIPTANHISKGMLELAIEGKVPDPEAEIILYCGGGVRSAISAENLQRMGYKNVLSLSGGIKGWVDSGYSIE